MPYPFSDTDPLTPLEDLLNDTVDAAQASTQRGAGSLATSGTGTPTAPVTATARVDFPTPFPVGTDVVVLACAFTGAPANRFATPTAIDVAGFTINVASTSASNQTVNYRWTAGAAS